MKKIKTWYKNLKIQRKMMYLTLGISVLILLVASVSLYLAAARMITEETEKTSEGVVTELSINVNNLFELVDQSFGYMANTNIVQEELKSETPYSSDGSALYSYYSRAGQIRRLMLQCFNSVYMDAIELTGYNGAEHKISINGDMDKGERAKAQELAEKANGRCIYSNAAETDGVIYMARQVKDLQTMAPLGVLIASIKVGYLEKMTESARESLTADILLIDSANQVIINTLDIDEVLLNGKYSSSSGSFSLKFQGKLYTCVYQKSANTGFILVSLIPRRFLQKTANRLLVQFVLLLLFSVLLCALLSSYIARSISGPIVNTNNAMKKFAGGDFAVRLPEGRTDEIGDMNMVFNQTIEEVERLLKKVVEMETVNKDIEFSALEAQINPHFLYNVLDTINWMARKNSAEKICRMVTAVSDLMRGSISNKKSMVSLREEMKYIQDYIYIQETRYGDRFTAEFEVDKTLEDIQIPKMTLQILVENAVVHGVENATWDTFLYVSAERTEEMAVIKVIDNGVGMSSERLSAVFNSEKLDDTLQSEDNRTHKHIGLNAVKKRLDYVYDGKASIAINSTEGQGTEVIVTIPIHCDRRMLEDGTTGNDLG